MAYVRGLAVRVLTHERARSGRRDTVDALRELARREGLAGVTVTRGIEGYSPRGGMRSAEVVELGDDLPVAVEIVDRAERIEVVLPQIEALVTEGTLTVAEVRLWVAAE